MPNALLLLLPIVSGARQWLVAQEGEQRGGGQSQAAQAWPKLKQARRVAGFNRSLAIGIAAQAGRGSLKVLRAVW